MQICRFWAEFDDLNTNFENSLFFSLLFLKTRERRRSPAPADAPEPLGVLANCTGPLATWRYPVHMKLRGCGTALVTPFRTDGSIDESAYRSLVEWQITSGIHFLVPCGTTGETPTLTHEEWLRVIDITIEV